MIRKNIELITWSKNKHTNVSIQQDSESTTVTHQTFRFNQNDQSINDAIQTLYKQTKQFNPREHIKEKY